MKHSKSIILASQSPRRKELLLQTGLKFSVSPADVDEQPYPGESPRRYVKRVALDKARVVAQRTRKGIIISADTIVVLKHRILGKPDDRQHAIRMLRMLSNTEHEVVTGVVVLDAETGKKLSRTSITRVWFKKLSLRDIESYAATGEPLDKAGAYGIQGMASLFVRRIDGCYFNVVGLPLSLVGTMLKSFGISIL